jgi:predicted N-formylglutamate amidohydrolase
MASKLILTCEHAHNDVPAELRSCFSGDESILHTHKAWDAGAFETSRKLLPLATGCLVGSISRLVVDLNRSLGHPNLHSDFVTNQKNIDLQRYLNLYYHPFRTSVQSLIAQQIAEGNRVVHISVHSFTPVLAGEIRQADVGLLFDPARKAEDAFCTQWLNAMHEANAQLCVRLNYPYLGTDDGHTTALRQQFSQEDYLGIELELNQKFFMLPNNSKDAFLQSIYAVTKAMLAV